MPPFVTGRVPLALKSKCSHKRMKPDVNNSLVSFHFLEKNMLAIKNVEGYLIYLDIKFFDDLTRVLKRALDLIIETKF